MTIEYSTFKNCSSLEELNFSKNTESIQVNLTQDDNIPDTCKIIVADKLYNDWLDNLQLQYCINFIVKLNNFILTKISSIKYGNIAASIIYMLKAVNLLDGDIAYQLQLLLENIKHAICIDDHLLSEVLFLLNKKENKDGQSKF